MSPSLVLQAVLRYGPSVLPLIQQLVAMVKANKTEVTDADLKELIAMGNKTADDYLKEAGIKS